MPVHHVLIADGDPQTLSTLARGLQDAGYQVSEAVDGDSAAQLCETAQPDLAILDVRLPGLSGAEVVRRIGLHSKVPILVLTTRDDMELVKVAIKEGALGFLVKPLDSPQMVLAVDTALARIADLKALRDSERSLNAALEHCRKIGTAVGLIMERYRLNLDTAFDLLRRSARTRRVKLSRLADDLIRAANALNVSEELLPKPMIKEKEPAK